MSLRTRRVLRVLALAAFCVCSVAPARAQFGQNKITYRTFKWSVYHSPHFDVHYYTEEEKQLEEVVSELESAYLDLSKRLDHEVQQKTPVILYRTHTEFEQTNIELGEIPEEVGGFSEPVQSRLVIPIDSPPDKRYLLIRHELTHIFQFDIFYAGSLRRALRSAPPTWLMEGMASYMADDEDSFDQMTIRDAVVNNEVPSIRDLDVLSFMTYRFGHAIFDFIETTYGPAGLRTFLFEFRKVLLTPNPGKAFEDAFGLSIDAFDRRFARFLRQRYLPILTEKRAPEDYGKEVGKTDQRRIAFSPALSPSGELVAALAAPRLTLDVVILSAKDGKLIRRLTPSFTTKWDGIVVELMQRNLAWSPDGDRLAFFVKKNNFRELLVYEPTTGKLLQTVPFRDIAACASPTFSPDGRSVAFSGNHDGVWDIFRYNFDTKQVDNLTQDEYYDTNPVYSADGKTVLYNRRIGSFEKIFAVTVGAPERKTQLTGGASSDIEPLFSKDGKWIYFSSDRGLYGVFNVHRMEVATGRIERLTDLIGGSFAPSEMSAAEDGTPQLAYAAFYGGTFRVYKMKVGGREVDRAIKVGEAEPQTSPLAPSRRAEFRAANRARALADMPPPIEGTARGLRDAPPPLPTPPPAKPQDANSPQTTPAPTAPPPPAPAPETPPEPDRADADLLPFRAPLQLGLDPSRKERYKLKWDIDVPSIGAGVTNDGTFLTDVTVNFTDLLGDQRVGVRAFSVSSFSNVELTYLNLGHRLDWGAQFIDYRDYYLAGGGSFGDQRIQRATKYTSLSAFASYPFNRYYRLEGSLGYAQRSNAYPTIDQSGLLQFTDFSDDFPIASLALVGDTTRFQSFGPYQGHRFRLELSEIKFTSGDSKGDSVTGISLDWRGYQRLTRRTLLAFRLSGVKQTGDRGNLYPLGGINQLRGFDYREFFGTNVVYANVEFRFPLIDFLQWGFGLPMGPFRGFVFADAGTAWFDDTLHFDCTDAASCQAAPATPVRGKAAYDPNLGILRTYKAKTDAGLYQDVHASAGVGFHVNVFGLPATWAFAKVYDGKHFGPYHSTFYIVYDW